MRTLFISIPFLISMVTFGQQPVIERVTAQICDTLSKMNTPLETLSKQESRNIIRTVIIKNQSDWIQELHEFKAASGKTGSAEFDFDQYFQHILQQDCENFRTINKKLDTYAANRENLRPLYMKTKEFVIGLEDNRTNKDLENLLSDRVRNEHMNTLLNKCKIEINKYKRTTTLSIILVFVDGYTFHVRYFDYLTDEPQFQVNVVFKDDKDVLIDNLVIKDKAQLMIELKERIEFNKKVDSGEIKIPLPPAPAPRGLHKNEE